MNFKGYKRNLEKTQEIIKTLTEVLSLHPHLRLGQLMTIAKGDADLFNIYDEKLIENIKSFFLSSND